MKRLRQLAPLALLLSFAAHADVVWKGDFETGNLSQWTEVWSVASDRMQVVSTPMREGRYALKVTVKQSDNPVNASGNRNELFYGSYEKEGSEYYYKWSTLFPQDFPRTSKWQVFTQWHHDGCCGSPPLEFYVVNDVMHMRVGGSSGKVLWTSPVVRDQWNDFVLHVKWSPNPTVGFVELYHNGKLAVPRRHEATRYAGMGGYLQFGYYRDASIEQTAALYHDGFTMATAWEDVMPTSQEEPSVETFPPSPAAPSPSTQDPSPSFPTTSGTETGLPPDDLPQEGLEPVGCGASATGGVPWIVLGSLSLLALRRRRQGA